jgi:hypothetical protein
MSTNASQRLSIRGWLLKLDNAGVFSLSKSSTLHGSQTSVTFPATGSGVAGAISLEDVRDLAAELINFCN